MHDEQSISAQLSARAASPDDYMSMGITEIENGFLIHYNGYKDGEGFSKVRHVSEAYWLGTEVTHIWNEHKTKSVKPVPPAPVTPDDDDGTSKL